MMIPIPVTIDATGVNRGLALAGEYTRRAPAVAVNTAACEVSIAAKFNLPAVTPARIDTELAVSVAPAIGKRGKPLKRKKAYFGKVGTAATSAVVPLAVLIVAARGRYGSNYNQRTNFRYALFGSPFKGVSRAQGQAAMRAIVHEMIAGRHSSGSFLRAGWDGSISKLLPLSDNRYRLRTSNNATGGFTHSHGANLGDATPAQLGNPAAFCIIENNIGSLGKNAASMDRAMQLYAAPALQSACDNEGRRQLDYYLQKSAAAELIAPFNAATR